MWRLLQRRHAEVLRVLDDRAPLLPVAFFGRHELGEVEARRASLPPQLHCLAERVAAYVGSAVVAAVPGAACGIGQDRGSS